MCFNYYTHILEMIFKKEAYKYTSGMHVSNKWEPIYQHEISIFINKQLVSSAFSQGQGTSKWVLA